MPHYFIKYTQLAFNSNIYLYYLLMKTKMPDVSTEKYFKEVDQTSVSLDVWNLEERFFLFSHPMIWIF